MTISYVVCYTRVFSCMYVCFDNMTSSPPPGNDDGGDDKMFVFLSVAVVLLTLLTVLVVTIVLAVLCLRYRREKTKVTSVDHLNTQNNCLTTAKPTCLVDTVLHVPLQSNRTKRTESDRNT